MKTLRNILAAIALLALPALAFAQERASGNVVTVERELGSFEAVKAGCALHVFLATGSPQMVKVETDDNLQDNITAKVTGGTLELGCNKLSLSSGPTSMNVYVTAPVIRHIISEGTAVIKSSQPLTGDELSLEGTSASKMNLEVNVTKLSLEFSGASVADLNVTANTVLSEVTGAARATMSGQAESQQAEVSGAGKLDAIELVSNTTDAEISGAGNASFLAKKQLTAELSGAGSMSYLDNETIKRVSKPGEYVLTFTGMENIKHVDIEIEGDESALPEVPAVPEPPQVPETGKEPGKAGDVEVIVNDRKIVVITDDTVKVSMGRNDIEIADDGNVKIKKDKKKKFDGHWAGFELGVNGYLTPGFDAGWDPAYSFLDLKYQKSINANINFFEQNINVLKNHLGMITGLGLSINNYRFGNDVILDMEGNTLGTVEPNGSAKYEKSKLVASWLTLPVLLEYQTNSRSKVNSFHITGGIQGGWRFGTHTKNVFELNGRQNEKNRHDFYMNPFKADAIVKVGWGVINLYATYSLTPMFEKGKAPELYPFSVGICLSDF